MAALDVYGKLKRLILHNEIKENTVLIEREVAERFGVSRIPVRETLLRLSTEGLLLETPKGILTKSYNVQLISDLYLCREALEGMATRLCAIRSTDREVEYLRLVFEQMRERIETTDFEDGFIEDLKLHRSIASGSRNNTPERHLSSIYDEFIMMHSRLGPLPFINDEDKARLVPSIVAEHRNIVEAISAHDPKAAEEAARISLHNAWSRIIKQHNHYSEALVETGQEVSAKGTTVNTPKGRSKGDRHKKKRQTVIKGNT